jgi:hypothetical protein
MSSGKPSPDLVAVRHWDASRRGEPFAMEVTDLRASNGSLCVDVAPLSGEVDDVFGASFEIGDLPGTQDETACLHLRFTPDAMAMSVFKHGDSYVLRLENGVTLRPTMLASGESGFVVEPSDLPGSAVFRASPSECPIGCDCVCCRAEEHHTLLAMA